MALKGSMQQLLAVPVAGRWVVTLVFMALVVVLSVTPANGRPGDSFFVWLVMNTATPLQKLLHVTIYAVLSVLWLWTLADISSRPLRMALSFALSAGLGTALEVHQTNVPGRFGTMMDVMLNALGAVIGLAAAIVLL